MAGKNEVLYIFKKNLRTKEYKSELQIASISFIATKIIALYRYIWLLFLIS